VLSNVLNNDQPMKPFSNQIVPAVSHWDNFWDIGGAAFEPLVMNWLEMTASGPPMEAVPGPLPLKYCASLFPRSSERF
jgi:hypothetical protein